MALKETAARCPCRFTEVEAPAPHRPQSGIGRNGRPSHFKIRKIPGRQFENQLDNFATMDNRLRGMCEKASNEKDPTRLMEIVKRIMAIYEEMDRAEKTEAPTSDD